MLTLTLCCAAASAWLWSAPGRRPRGVPRPTGPTKHNAAPLKATVESAPARAALCAAALGILGLLLSGPAAAAVGLGMGIGLAVWIGRLEPPSVTRAREEVERDLPLAVELLAACANVGRAPEASLPAVSRAIGGALGARLDEVTARLTLGADPVAEWARLASHPQLGQLGATLVRSAQSGAPLARSLSRLAEDSRRERRTQTLLRARNVGVKAAGPLAACFLPAFMLVGVVPTVAGGFSSLFS